MAGNPSESQNKASGMKVDDIVNTTKQILGHIVDNYTPEQGYGSNGNFVGKIEGESPDDTKARLALLQNLQAGLRKEEPWATEIVRYVKNNQSKNASLTQSLLSQAVNNLTKEISAKKAEEQAPSSSEQQSAQGEASKTPEQRKGPVKPFSYILAKFSTALKTTNAQNNRVVLQTPNKYPPKQHGWNR